jgi:peptidoglycan/LPS O-acetylase OafA/YrhL
VADQQPQGRLAALDGLRGLAIIMVLFVHFVGDATPHGAVERMVVKVANYGIWGVDLFFVLSGFLITGILLGSKGSPTYFRDFYVRRTLRIFPLYYGVLALLFVVAPSLPLSYPEGLAESAKHQAWLWCYGTNLYVAWKASWALPYVSHFWSLAVEEHFYLLWPWLVWALDARALSRVCFGIMALSLGLRIAMSSAGASDVALVALTPCRLDALCVGGLLAVVVREHDVGRVARRAANAAPVLGGLVLLVSAIHVATEGALRSVLLPARGTLVALTFGAVLVLAVAADRATWLGRCLTTRPLRMMGKYSYGIYVFHGIIAYGMQARSTSSAIAAAVGSTSLAMAIAAVVGTAFSVAVAAVSFEVFEKRFLVLKQRLTPSPKVA